jgi:hypothetical protein
VPPALPEPLLPALPEPLLPLPVLLPLPDESDGADIPPEAGADDDVASGAGLAVLDVEDEGDAGAGVLTGAVSLGVLDVAGVAAVSSFFLQPARAASTTAVANIVLRINIGPPCS